MLTYDDEIKFKKTELDQKLSSKVEQLKKTKDVLKY